MCKVIQFFLAIVLFLLVAMVGISLAYDKPKICTHIWPSGNVEYYECGTVPICPVCPTCPTCPTCPAPPDCPQCPDVHFTCQCDSGGVVVPGLWAGKVEGVPVCGRILQFQGAFVLYSGEDPYLGAYREGAVFLMENMKKLLKMVGSCE